MTGGPRKIARADVVPELAVRRRRAPYGVVHTHVIRDTRLSAQARLLYAILCTYANAGGVAFPTVHTLEQDMGVTHPTRLRAQGELVHAGVLEVVQKFTENGRQQRSYYVLLDDLAPVTGGGKQAYPPGGDADVPPPVKAGVPLTGTQTYPPRGGTQTYPLNNHHEQEAPHDDVRARGLQAVRDAIAQRKDAS